MGSREVLRKKTINFDFFTQHDSIGLYFIKKVSLHSNIKKNLSCIKFFKNISYYTCFQLKRLKINFQAFCNLVDLTKNDGKWLHKSLLLKKVFCPLRSLCDLRVDQAFNGVELTRICGIFGPCIHPVMAYTPYIICNFTKSECKH